MAGLNRRDFLRRAAVLVVLSATLLSACADSDSAENAQEADNAGNDQKGGSLVFAMEAEPTVLDPHRYTSWATWRYIHTMFEPLVQRDLTKASGEVPYSPIVGALATDWDISPDGLTYTFDLREGVKFHDGTDFDAEAVKFNIERATDESQPHYDPTSAAVNAYTWQSLKGVEVTGPLQIKIHLKEPFGEFLGMLAEGGIGSTAILSPTALEKYGQDGFADNPVGTGPFRFVERERGGTTIVERNDEYWGEKALLDQVIFRPIEDAAARVLALESGDVDMISVVPPDSVQRLEDSGFEVSMGETAHIWHLSFNFKEKPIQNLKVRQAINMAINKEAMVRELLVDTATPAHGIVPPANPAYDSGFEGYQYDPERAAALLQEAGYGDGFETHVLTSNTGSGLMIPVPMNEWIQRDLAKIGITYKLDVFEWNTHTQNWATGGKPGQGLLNQAWGSPTPYQLEIMAHSKFAPGEGGCCNVGSFNSPEVDALLDEARVEMDDERRYALYGEVNETLSREASHVPVVSDLAPMAFNSRVKGFVHAPLEWYTFSTIYKEE